MADEVEVKFGGDTSDLDASTEKAVTDIKDVQGAVGGLQQQLSGLGQRLSQAFQNFRTGNVTQGLGQITQGMGSAEAGVGSFSRVALLGFGAVVGATALATKALMDFGRQNSEIAQEISNLSQQIGMNVTETSQWLSITQNAGVSSQTFASAVDSLTRNLAQARSGTKQQAEAFAELGINATEAMTSQQLLLQVADRFHEMPDGPEKTAIAVRLLGQAGAQLIPVLNQGSQALTAQAQAASDSGAAISDAYVQAGLQVNDSFNQMDQASQGLSNSLFTALAPAITSTAQGLADFTTDMAAAFKEGGDLHGVIVLLGGIFRAVAIVVGAAGVVLSDIFAAAVIICIPIVASLAASVIALKRAFEGDFAGAARAFGEAAQAATKGIADEIHRAEQVHEHYTQFVRNELNGNNGRTAAPGLDPAQAQAGAAIIDRIRAQQAADAQRVADAQARREAAQRAAAERAARQAAERELQAHIATLSAEQEADQDNYTHVMQLEQQKLDALKAFYGENSRQYQQELRAQERMENQHAQLMSQIDRDRVASRAQIMEGEAQTDLQISAGKLDQRRQEIEQMAQLDQINEQQKIAMLRAVDLQEEQLQQEHEDRIYQIHLAALQDQLNDEELRPRERERINREIEQLEAQHQQKMRELQATASNDATQSQRAAAAASANSWKSALQPVGQAINGMFQNIYNGTMSFKQAILQAMDQVLFSFVQKGIEMAVNWAANQLAMTGATTAGVAARTTAEATGAAATKGISGAAAMGDIMNSAWRAAAGAYAAISAIPYVGPFLAPAIAAGLLATVIGFAGNIVSSRGGLGQVKKDGQMAELHKDETVLPASLATPLRAMMAEWDTGRSSNAMRIQASGGAAPGGNYVGGDTNIHYNPQNQVGSPSLEQQLKRDSIGLRRWMKNEMRNGRLKVN